MRDFTRLSLLIWAATCIVVSGRGVDCSRKPALDACQSSVEPNGASIAGEAQPDEDAVPMPFRPLFKRTFHPPTDTASRPFSMRDIYRYEAYFDTIPSDAYSITEWSYNSAVPADVANMFDDVLEDLGYPDTMHAGIFYDADRFNYYMKRPLPSGSRWKAWAYASYNFAQWTQGRVHVVLPSGASILRPSGELYTGYWDLFELYTLTTYGRVSEIVRYDYDASNSDRPISVHGTVWRAGDPPLGSPPDFSVGPTRPPEFNDEII